MRWSLRASCALLFLSVSVSRATVPINGVTLLPGDTLYVRFAVTDFTNFPNPLNAVYPQFNYSPNATVHTERVDLYDNANGVIGTTGAKVVNFISLGTAPIFADPSRGGYADGVVSYAADLSDYLDGDGLVSLTWLSGAPVNVTSFDAHLGQYSSSGGFAPGLPYIYNYSVDSVPAPLPEPSALLPVFSVVLLTLARRKSANP